MLIKIDYSAETTQSVVKATVFKLILHRDFIVYGLISLKLFHNEFHCVIDGETCDLWNSGQVCWTRGDKSNF